MCRRVALRIQVPACVQHSTHVSGYTYLLLYVYVKYV